MAHFAKIGLNGKVIAVLYVNDSDTLNTNNIEDEDVGQRYLELHNNWPRLLWIKTSYNTICNQHKNGGTPFRGNYAAVGSVWDEENNIFWPRKPYPSWVKDLPTASWKSPIGDMPTLTLEQINQNSDRTHSWSYFWNETTQNWDLVNGLI
jgi:hypothetical protein